MPQRREVHAEPNLRNAIFDRQNPDTTVLRGNEDNPSPERPNKCSSMRHELEGNVERGVIHSGIAQYGNCVINKIYDRLGKK